MSRLRVVALLTCCTLAAVLSVVLPPVLYKLEDALVQGGGTAPATPLLTGPGPALGAPDAEWSTWRHFTVPKASGGGGTAAAAVAEREQVASEREQAAAEQAAVASPAAKQEQAAPAPRSLRRGGATPPGVTAEEVERSAARVSPDLFAALPDAYLPGYKAPCWRVTPEGAPTTGEDGALRCMPYVFILGVFQCGVRDIYSRLLMHPDVAATANAAPHWWDEIHSFQRYMDIMAPALPRVAEAPERVVFGDASLATFTFTWTGSERLHAEWTAAMRECREKDCDGAKQPCVDDTCYAKSNAVPVGGEAGLTLPWLMRAALGANVKHVVLLRDPVERLHAAFYGYHHYGAKYTHTEAGFRAFALEMTGHVANCTASGAYSEAQCVTKFESLNPHNENVFYHADQVLKSIYVVYMEGWMAAFPRDDVLVLRLEDWASGRDALRTALQQLLAHLQLAPPDAALWERMLAAPVTRNGGLPEARARPAMEADTRDALRAFYAPYNARLAALLGDDKWRWGY